MRYFEGFWDESRGDEFDRWGKSWWYFEVDEESNVLRQVEQYQNGPTLRYDEEHLESRFGGLSEKPLDAEYTSDLKLIDRSEFEAKWQLATYGTELSL